MNTKRVCERSDILESVFKTIRAECARNSISIEGFCKLLDIERKTFYNWENKKDFPVSYLVKMADIFHVTPDDILGIKPSTNKTT
jgi:DNA-binding XRE family transcriptional regulator